MTDIINSLDDFEDLGVLTKKDNVPEIEEPVKIEDLEDSSKNDVKSDPVPNLDDLDLNLEETTTVQTPQKDEEKHELATSIPPKKEDDVPNLDLDIPLDDLNTPEPTKQEEKTPELPPVENLDSVDISDLSLDIGTEEKTPELPPVETQVSQVEITNTQIPPMEETRTEEKTPELPPQTNQESQAVQTPPKKRGRPKKTKSSDETSEGQTSSKIPSLEDDKIIIDGEYNPRLDVSLLRLDKYQSRHFDRTAEEVASLAEKIQLQGQLEPIHVVVEDDHYQVLAGFGRTSAILSLKLPTIKAIVHKDLTENQIMTISAGTNEGRLELSDWDKITSVGKYAVAHPEIKHDDPDKSNPETLVNIFGYSRSTVYRYVNIYNFCLEHKAFFNFFSTIKVPIQVMVSIFESQKDITNADHLVEKLKLTEIWRYPKQRFELEFANLLMENKLNSAISNDLNSEINVPELGNTTPNSIKKDADKVSKNKEVPVSNIDTSDERSKLISASLNQIDIKFQEIERLFNAVLVIEEYRAYMDKKQITGVQQKLARIAKLQTKFI